MSSSSKHVPLSHTMPFASQNVSGSGDGLGDGDSANDVDNTNVVVGCTTCVDIVNGSMMVVDSSNCDEVGVAVGNTVVTMTGVLVGKTSTALLVSRSGVDDTIGESMTIVVVGNAVVSERIIDVSMGKIKLSEGIAEVSGNKIEGDGVKMLCEAIISELGIGMSIDESSTATELDIVKLGERTNDVDSGKTVDVSGKNISLEVGVGEREDCWSSLENEKLDVNEGERISIELLVERISVNDDDKGIVVVRRVSVKVEVTVGIGKKSMDEVKITVVNMEGVDIGNISMEVVERSVEDIDGVDIGNRPMEEVKITVVNMEGVDIGNISMEVVKRSVVDIDGVGIGNRSMEDVKRTVVNVEGVGKGV